MFDHVPTFSSFQSSSQSKKPINYVYFFFTHKTYKYKFEFEQEEFSNKEMGSNFLS